MRIQVQSSDFMWVVAWGLEGKASKPLPNLRLKLSGRGGRLEGKGSVLIAAAAPRSLSAIR